MGMAAAAGAKCLDGGREYRKEVVVGLVEVERTAVALLEVDCRPHQVADNTRLQSGLEDTTAAGLGGRSMVAGPVARSTSLTAAVSSP